MRHILLFCLFVTVCCLGCRQEGFNVGGKVTYPDGKPVTRGKVTMTSGKFTANGDIIADGTYSISARVPTGTYKVSVQAFEYTQSGMAANTTEKSFLDPKYDSPETSNITCEVKGPTSFNITVEKP